MGPKSHLSQFGSPIDSLEERRRASSPALCSELRSRSSYALVSATILFSRRLRAKKDFSVHHTLNLELISPVTENQPFFGICLAFVWRLETSLTSANNFRRLVAQQLAGLNFFHQTTMAFLEVWLRESLRQYQTVSERWRPGRTATRGGTEPPPH